MSKETLDLKMTAAYTITKDGKQESHKVEARIEREAQDELTPEQDVRMAHIVALTPDKHTTYESLVRDVSTAASAIAESLKTVKKTGT
jgi:hypothetical protein